MFPGRKLGQAAAPTVDLSDGKLDKYMVTGIHPELFTPAPAPAPAANTESQQYSFKIFRRYIC